MAETLVTSSAGAITTQRGIAEAALQVAGRVVAIVPDDIGSGEMTCIF